MSISNELQELKLIKAALKAALISRDIPIGDNLYTYADGIVQISSGIPYIPPTEPTEPYEPGVTMEELEHQLNELNYIKTVIKSTIKASGITVGDDFKTYADAIKAIKKPLFCTTTGTGDKSGRNWANAIDTDGFQRGVGDATKAYSEIRLAGSTEGLIYRPTSNLSTFATFLVSIPGQTISGAWDPITGKVDKKLKSIITRSQATVTRIVYCNANGLTFRNLTITGGEASLAGGINVDRNYVTIDSCIIENNIGTLGCAGIMTSTYDPVNTVIKNCIIRNNKSLTTRGAGLSIGTYGAKTLVQGCVFYDNTTPSADGCHINDDYGATTIVHCTLGPARDFGLYLTSSAVIKNTILFECNVNYISAAGSASWTNCYNTKGHTGQGLTNISSYNRGELTSPMFNNGYRLMEGSYLIKKGILLGPDFDMDGTLRDPNTPSIGAFEYKLPTPYTGAVYVSATKGRNDNDGYSWTNCKRDIQDAIDVCPDNGTVWVDKSTYNNDWNRRSGKVYGIEINRPMTLIGGLPYGCNTPDRDRPTDKTTIITTSTDANMGCRAFSCRSSGTKTIDGFAMSIKHNSSTKYPGGGIAINDAPAHVTNCEITGCEASFGGGIVMSTPGCSVTNTTISGCHANAVNTGGGGIYINSSNQRIENCIITNNKVSASISEAPNNSNQYGGGISILPDIANINITNCIISNNSSGQGGGVICVSRTTSAKITNTTITNNISTSSGGGGISCATGSQTEREFRNVILWGNKSGTQNNNLSGDYSLFNCAGNVGSGIGMMTINTINDNPTSPKGPFFSNPSPSAGDTAITSRDDWMLLAPSPCLRNGAHDGAPLTDITGYPRPNPPSIGAFELHETNT